jgi:sugar phosphate isomerase/epimerase
MLTEIAALGFEYVELSHGIRITLVPGIMRAVEAGVIKVSSTHNFCPLPTGVVQAAPNLFQPSVSEHREHDQWLRHTKRTIDFAAQMKAQVVVCHLGSVTFFWFNPARDLRNYLRDHHGAGRTPDDTTYHALLKKCLVRLRKRMPPFVDQVKASINEVLEHAKLKGVKLGFENREKIEELPVDADYPAFIASFAADAPVGYWHDTGHADIKEGMGLLQHRSHLESLSSRTIGWHLHDVDAHGHDHQPIGAGHINFRMVSEFWRPEHLLTLEFGPRLTVEEVVASKARVEELLSQRFGG